MAKSACSATCKFKASLSVRLLFFLIPAQLSNSTHSEGTESSRCTVSQSSTGPGAGSRNLLGTQTAVTPTGLCSASGPSGTPAGSIASPALGSGGPASGPKERIVLKLSRASTGAVLAVASVGQLPIQAGHSAPAPVTSANYAAGVGEPDRQEYCGMRQRMSEAESAGSEGAAGKEQERRARQRKEKKKKRQKHDLDPEQTEPIQGASFGDSYSNMPPVVPKKSRFCGSNYLPQSGQAYSASPSSCSAYNNRVFSTMTNHPHPAPDMSLQNSGCISGVGAVGTLIDEVSCAEATHHSHQSGPRESPASTSPSLHGSSPYMPTAQLPFSASWWSSGPTMTAASGDMEASIEAASGLGTATLNGASVSSIITMNNNVSNNSNNEDYNEVDVSSFGANGQPSSHFPESLEAEEKAVRREARDKRRQEREKRRREKHLARQQLQNQRDNLHNPSYQTSGNLISRVESQQMLIASNASVPENDYSQVPAGHVESPQSTGNSLHSRSGFLQLGLLSDVVAYEEDFGDAGSPLSPHLAGPLGDKREQRKKVISEKHDRDEVVNEGGGGQKERAFQQAEQLKYANIEMNDSGELRRQERHERRERRRQQRELLKRQKASLNCITQASHINISSTNPGNNADPVLVKEAPTSDTLDFNSQSLSLSGTEAALPTSIEPHLLCTGKEDNKMEEPSALAYGTLARGVCGESNWPETRNHSATSSGQFTMSTLPTIRSTTKPVEYSAKSDCQTDARPIKPSEVSAELDGGVTRRPTNQASLQSCSPRSLCLSKLIPSALGDKQISTTSNRPLLHTKQATYIPASSESSGSGSPNRHRKNRSSQLNIDSSHHTLVQNESIAGMKSKENCSFQPHRASQYSQKMQSTEKPSEKQVNQHQPNPSQQTVVNYTKNGDLSCKDEGQLSNCSEHRKLSVDRSDLTTLPTGPSGATLPEYVDQRNQSRRQHRQSSRHHHHHHHSHRTQQQQRHHHQARPSDGVMEQAKEVTIRKNVAVEGSNQEQIKGEQEEAVSGGHLPKNDPNTPRPLDQMHAARLLCQSVKYASASRAQIVSPLIVPDSFADLVESNIPQNELVSERRDCDIKPFDHIIRKKPRTHKHRGNLGKKRVAETDLGLIESPSGASSSLLRSRSTSSHSSSSLDYASKSASGADLLSSLSSKRSLKRSHFPSCLPSHSKLTENKSTLPLSSGSANYSSAINEYTSRTNPNLTLAEQARPEPTHQAKLDSFSKHRLKHPQTASMSCVSSCSSGTSDSLTPPMLVNSPPKDSGSHSRHSSSLHIAESTKGDVEKPKSGLVTKTDDLPCQNNRHHMENSVDKTTTVRQNKSKGAYSNSKLELLFERLLRLEHSHLALKMSHILIHFNRNHESSISIKEPIGCHDPARSFGGTQILHNNGPKVIAFDLRQLPDACLTQLSELIAEDEALSLKLEESNTTAAASQVLLKPTSPFSAKNGSKHHPSSQELEVEAEINKPIHSGKLITSKEPLEEGEASSSSSSSSHNYASSTSASSSSRPFSLSPPSSVTSPSSISSSSPKHSPVYNSPSNKTNLPNVFCDLVPSKTADQLSQKPAEEPGRYHESNRATFHRSRHLPVDMPLTPNKPLEAKPARQSKGSLPVGSTGAAAAPRLTRLHQSGPCEADPLVSASVSGRDKPPSKSLEQSVQQRNVVPSSSDSADQTDEATDTDA